MAGHPGFTRIITGTFEDRTAKGARIWLRSHRQADKVIAELFSDRRTSRRSAQGVVIEVDVIEAERMVRAAAHLNGYAVTEDAAVDARLAQMTARIDASIKHMQVKGQLKLFNRQYAAMDRSSRPAFTEYLIGKLRGVAQLHAQIV